MAAAFTMLLAKIAAVVKWFGDLFVSVFVAIWHVVTDLVCWAFDGFLGVAVEALADVDTSGISSYGAAWSSLPGEVINILQLLGVGEAMAIIASAITIRVTLQLIPFVRLGS